VNSDQVFGLIMSAMFGVVLPVALVIGIPLGKAWARRLESGGSAQADPQALAELDHLRARMAELEERLDFTERVLAERRDQARLPGGDR
jgi:hypothetical protein